MNDEARRFFRYVLPGVVYVIETLVFLLLALPEPTMSWLAGLNGKDSLGPAVAIFILSGGLGYIFSAIHHWVFWLCPRRTFNHQKLIATLLNEDLLTIQNEDGLRLLGLKKDEETKTVNVSNEEKKYRKQAWTFSQSLWYLFLKSDPPSEAPVPNPDKDAIDKLGQQAQGAGTACAASFFSLLTVGLIGSGYYCYYGWHYINTAGMVVMLALWIIITLAFRSGYTNLAGFAHGAYSIHLTHECSKAENKFLLKRYCDEFEKLDQALK